MTVKWNEVENKYLSIWGTRIYNFLSKWSYLKTDRYVIILKLINILLWDINLIWTNQITKGNSRDIREFQRFYWEGRNNLSFWKISSFQKLLNTISESVENGCILHNWMLDWDKIELIYFTHKHRKNSQQWENWTEKLYQASWYHYWQTPRLVRTHCRTIKKNEQSSEYWDLILL